MATIYNINKGIGKSVEFKGLKSQYLFIFTGGLLAIFILYVIMFSIGLNQSFCIVFSIIIALVLVWQTFSLNAKHGEHGLMKIAARKNHPNYLVNRKSISQLIKRRFV